MVPAFYLLRYGGGKGGGGEIQKKKRRFILVGREKREKSWLAQFYGIKGRETNAKGEEKKVGIFFPSTRIRKEKGTEKSVPQREGKGNNSSKGGGKEKKPSY